MERGRLYILLQKEIQFRFYGCCFFVLKSSVFLDINLQGKYNILKIKKGLCCGMRLP